MAASPVVGEVEIQPHRQVGRLDAVDAARGLALCGMLFAHFASSTSPGDPGWLQALDNMADGRAAPLFCVLLGLSAGLSIRHRPPTALARRGLVLLGIGLAIWPVVENVLLILPQYGIILAIVALAARLPGRWLLACATVCWTVPSAFAAVVDGHGLRGAARPDTYDDLIDVGHVAWQLVWSGGYPIVGWTGFALVGLWLSRLRLADRATQRGLFVGGAAVAALQPVVSAMFEALDGVHRSRDAGGLATFFDGVAHSNHMSWYLLATGSAVAVIGACLLVAQRFPLRPLVVIGRCSLTLYLLHLIVGAVAVWPWIEDSRPPLVVQVAATACTAAAFAVLAGLWLRRFRRGPVESAVRFLAR